MTPMKECHNKASGQSLTESSTSSWRYHRKTRTKAPLEEAGKKETCKETPEKTEITGRRNKAGIRIGSGMQKRTAAERYRGFRKHSGKAERI